MLVVVIQVEVGSRQWSFVTKMEMETEIKILFQQLKIKIKTSFFFLPKFLMDDLDPLNPICQHLQKKKKKKMFLLKNILLTQNVSRSQSNPKQSEGVLLF